MIVNMNRLFSMCKVAAFGALIGLTSNAQQSKYEHAGENWVYRRAIDPFTDAERVSFATTATGSLGNEYELEFTCVPGPNQNQTSPDFHVMVEDLPLNWEYSINEALESNFLRSIKVRADSYQAEGVTLAQDEYANKGRFLLLPAGSTVREALGAAVGAYGKALGVVMDSMACARTYVMPSTRLILGDVVQGEIVTFAFDTLSPSTRRIMDLACSGTQQPTEDSGRTRNGEACSISETKDRQEKKAEVDRIAQQLAREEEAAKLKKEKEQRRKELEEVDVNKVYRVGEPGLSPPELIYNVDPEYSEEARRAKLEGTVQLEGEVWPDGRLHNLRVIRFLGSGPGLVAAETTGNLPVSPGLGLEERAVECVQRWKFVPAKKNGISVKGQVSIEVNFRLL